MIKENFNTIINRPSNSLFQRVRSVLINQRNNLPELVRCLPLTYADKKFVIKRRHCR